MYRIMSYYLSQISVLSFPLMFFTPAHIWDLFVAHTLSHLRFHSIHQYASIGTNEGHFSKVSDINEPDQCSDEEVLSISFKVTTRLALVVITTLTAAHLPCFGTVCYLEY